jgi:hypothetical protein
VLELTDYTIVERACKGTGFDYWLGDEDDDLFQWKARLEISGILKGTKKRSTQGFETNSLKPMFPIKRNTPPTWS